MPELSHQVRAATRLYRDALRATPMWWPWGLAHAQEKAPQPRSLPSWCT